jgi:putative inner membrane protein yhaI
MNTFIQSEFIKFKIEVVELIKYVSKLRTLTMNVQTYLSINILVLLGIEANIFMFSIPFDKAYNQEYYNILFYVGHTLYILFVFITNYMRLNYYKKDSFNWLNAIIMIFLIMVLLLGNSIAISSSNFRFSGTTNYILGNQVLWSIDVPELFFPFLIVLILFGAFGIDKLWSNYNIAETNGIIFDNKVIDVWWGNRNDLTDGQIKTLKLYYSRQDNYPFWVDIYKSILIDSLWFYGRSTVRQWGMFNVFLAFIMYNFVITYTIEPSILRYALYIYLTYTVITMICRRLMDTNSSIFWLIFLFVPFVNIYVLYLLYNKTSAVYDQESNLIFYYPL